MTQKTIGQNCLKAKTLRPLEKQNCYKYNHYANALNLSLKKLTGILKL